jgi:hypothetical protein
VRRRWAGRALGAMMAVALVLAIAVGGVVLLLRNLDVELPFVAQCTASDGESSASLDPDQAANAALLAAIALERGLPARAVTIAIATAMQESRLRNIDYGDRDSIGLFQQRPSQGWGSVEQIMDPVYATNAFYDALVNVDGYEDMEITEAAQAVQRSAYPEAYAQHEATARLFASALTGWSPGALGCRLATPTDADDGALADMLARDLPSASIETDDSDAVVLSLDVGDGDRSAWVLAHWAVATAAVTGVQQVVVGDLEWTRGEDAVTGWNPAPEPGPAGLVSVR